MKQLPQPDRASIRSRSGGGRGGRYTCLLAAALLGASCAEGPGRRGPIPFEEEGESLGPITMTRQGTAGQFVRVGPDGRTFRRGRERFIPFGCNYFDPDTGWAPQLWQRFDRDRVEQHFAAMRSLGVNCARVFLTAQSFFPDGESLDRRALARLETLLGIADRHGVLIQVTGPDHWEGTPPWRAGDFYNSPEARVALVRFWELFAARFRDDARIFSYDIMNEPHVPWSSEWMRNAWPEWLRARYQRIGSLRRAWRDPADGLRSWNDAPVPEDRDAPGSPLLYDYECFREALGTDWVAVQSEAIRRVDANHLITVGLVQWSVPLNLSRPSLYAAVNPLLIAPYVDFITVHFYPLAGDPFTDEESFRRNLAYLEAAVRYVDVGMPIVLGEFGWYGGDAPPGMESRTAEDQLHWNRSVLDTTFDICTGWFNWAYADTPAATDISRSSGLVESDGTVKAWGAEFRRRGRLLIRNRPHYRPATVELEPEYRMVLTSSEASREALEGFQALARRYRRPGIRPHERLGD